MNQLTVIDFFCGAGGFSEGFRQKGFRVLKGYDNWQPAIDTFNHNFESDSTVKNILDFKDSIEEIDLLPNTDIIIGSPPCVSFSSSNISGKADKESGVLLTKIFLRIVAVKKYQKGSTLKAWYMENVANSRNYLADYYTFNDLGLGDWAKKNKLVANKKAIILKDNQPLINSADYGSYQARKRAISGEIIKKGKLIIPESTHSETQKDNLHKWNTLGNLLLRFPKPNSKKTNNKLVDPVYNSIQISSNLLTDHFYDSGLYKSEWRQSREHKVNHYCMGKMSFPENKEKPSRTITATKSGTSREALIYKSEYNRKGNGEYRSPTVREAASIMGFPFTYQFLGSSNNKWRLVGNAVCPSVSRAFASELLNQLENSNNDRLNLTTIPNIEGVQNLNDFQEKNFDKQPKRTKNSRFRRHPIKAGNLTVTLSNFDIEKNSKTKNKWFTSIQYGTGVGYKNQKVEDDFYKKIEPLIIKEKNGSKFIKIINNGFSEKIGSAKDLQKIEMRNHPNFNRDYDDDDNERILSYKKNIDENSINDFAIIFEELTQIYKNVFNKYEFLEKDILIDEEKRKNSKGVNLTKLPSNFILYGPPGTGKTYKTVDIAASIIGNINEDIKTIDNVIDYDMDEEKFHNNNTEIFNAGLSEKGDKEKGIKGDTVHFVTFHQNYSYEEFVGGLRPDIGNDQGSLKFKWQPGIFIKACAKALELARVDTTDKITSPEEWFFGECSNYKSRNYKYKDDQKCEKIDKVVLIIDEINRANISRVFGELITLMESDKRIGGKHQLIITLPNGDKKFGVPANLIIMGTMNTADKSLALLDVALRRRFEFIGLFPKPKLAKVEKHKKILKDLNEKIRDQLNMGLQIGHSYFMSTEEIKDENEFLKDIFNKKIIPLLNEYFMGNRKKVEEILKDIVGTELDENGVLKCLGPWEKPSKD